MVAVGFLQKTRISGGSSGFWCPPIDVFLEVIAPTVIPAHVAGHIYGAAGRALEEYAQRQIFVRDSGRQGEGVLRDGAVADRGLIVLVDDAIAIEVFVFDIAGSEVR